MEEQELSGESCLLDFCTLISTCQKCHEHMYVAGHHLNQGSQPSV